MQIKILLPTLLLALLAGSSARAALTPADHPLFDGDAVHEIHLTFAPSDWYDQLEDNFEHYDDPPYLTAEFDWDGVHLDSIGVRFKGNSSYMGYYGVKKSFKLDIDEFVADQEIYGLDKFSLNNCYLDPSFVREKCAYELCEAVGLAACRTNYAAVYINGTYWGLYLLVEQIDQEFLESRFGANEDGNLWKGEPYGSLEYLGASESSYYNNYELKTNEDENDWSGLVEMIDKLNNTALSALPDSLHNLVDIDSAMGMLAMENFTVNLDSYIGRCANYYLYQRELDGRFVFMKWDQNEAWGIFNMYNLSSTQLKQLSPYWVNPQYGEDRPLAERLWQIEPYADVYLGHMQKLMSGIAEPTTLLARMESLRDLIRPYVYSDTNMMFSTSQFEGAMSSDQYASSGGPGGRPIPGLNSFIQTRDTYLRAQLGAWTQPEGLVLNELMAANNSSVTDEHGDHDDWIEIANTGPSAVSLAGLGLTDHLEGTPDFIFPDITLMPGEYLVVWADEETEQGDLHTPFKLDADGEDIYLTDGAVVIDRVTYPELSADVSWGRWPDGDGGWQLLSASTPGAENENPSAPENVVLYINEFLALNDTGLQDEAGQYEDWVEIYNPGPADVQMGGLFLTDDLTVTTQYALPDTVLAAGDFLLVWCDSDPEDGPLHASFKLSGDGEEIGLFGRLSAGNLLIDSYDFGAQTADVSTGREIDGGATWSTFTIPTPGASNNNSTSIPTSDIVGLRLLPAYPNPFNPQTTLSFELPAPAHVRLEIFDARGRAVARLVNETLDDGLHAFVWNGRDKMGRSLTSGIYFSRLIADGKSCTGRLTLVR